MNVKCEKCTSFRTTQDGESYCDTRYEFTNNCKDFELRTGNSDMQPAENIFESLKNLFSYVCEQYRETFIRKYFSYDDLSYQNSWWVGDEPGGLLFLDADYTFSFDTIRYCVDNNVDRNTLVEWCEYCNTVADFEITTPNIKAWCKGCPHVTDEQLEKLSQLRSEFNEEIARLVDEMKKNENKSLF